MVVKVNPWVRLGPLRTFQDASYFGGVALVAKAPPAQASSGSRQACMKGAAPNLEGDICQTDKLTHLEAGARNKCLAKQARRTSCIVAIVVRRTTSELG